MDSSATLGRSLPAVARRARVATARAAMVACALLTGTLAGAVAPPPAAVVDTARVVVRPVPGAAAAAAHAADSAGGPGPSVPSRIRQPAATGPAAPVPNPRAPRGAVEV